MDLRIRNRQVAIDLATRRKNRVAKDAVMIATGVESATVFHQLEDGHQRPRRLKPAHVDMSAVRLDPTARLRKRTADDARVHEVFLADIASSTREAMTSFSTSLAPS